MDDTSIQVDLQFGAPSITGASGSACIAWRRPNLQASIGRIESTGCSLNE
ncbi:hypothetical protein [Burkholderia sp. BCC1977]|nr:hypothetical protein [Burkholderia sp. BCC1977]